MDLAVNFAKSALASGITSGAGSLTLVAGGGVRFAVVPWNGVIYDSTSYSDPADDPAVEVVRCTLISTDTLTVTRGQEGTSAANHNTAGHTYTLVAGPTAKLLTDILGISITGSAAVSTTATITDDISTNATMYPVWATATTGNLALKTSSTKLTYNPLTGALTASGAITANGFAGATLVLTAPVSTDGAFATIANVGDTIVFGVESSVAAHTYTGSLAYAALFGNATGGRATQIVSAGSVVATFLAGGNVGIGTTAPIGKLHLDSGGTNYAPSVTYHATAAWSLESASVELAAGVNTAPPYAYWLQTRYSGSANWPLSINPLGGNVGIGTTAPGSLLSIGGDANGGQAGIRVATELLTVAAATTSATVGSLLPAGAIVLSVSCMVTTVIPTATSFTLKSTTNAVVFTGAVPVAVFSTDPGTTHWAATTSKLSTVAQTITLTITGSTPANNSGRVRITVYYFLPTAPTS